jgi:hypothetical protein
MEYFFELIKSNAIIFSILITGSFSKIDQNQLNYLDHFFPSDSGLVIKNYNLDNNYFESVDFILTKNYGTLISFHTSDPKYFENPELYFGKSVNEQIKKPFEINGLKVSLSKKQLGDFQAFDNFYTVSIYKSKDFGYTISIRDKIKPINEYD